MQLLGQLCQLHEKWQLLLCMTSGGSSQYARHLTFANMQQYTCHTSEDVVTAGKVPASGKGTFEAASFYGCRVTLPAGDGAMILGCCASARPRPGA